MVNHTSKKTLTFVLMDAPFENARTTTALRLIDIAAPAPRQHQSCAEHGDR